MTGQASALTGIAASLTRKIKELSNVYNLPDEEIEKLPATEELEAEAHLDTLLLAFGIDLAYKGRYRLKERAYRKAVFKKLTEVSEKIKTGEISDNQIERINQRFEVLENKKRGFEDRVNATQKDIHLRNKAYESRLKADMRSLGLELTPNQITSTATMLTEMAEMEYIRQEISSSQSPKTFSQAMPQSISHETIAATRQKTPKNHTSHLILDFLEQRQQETGSLLPNHDEHVVSSVRKGELAAEHVVMLEEVVQANTRPGQPTRSTKDMLVITQHSDAIRLLQERFPEIANRQRLYDRFKAVSEKMPEALRAATSATRTAVKKVPGALPTGVGKIPRPHIPKPRLKPRAPQKLGAFMARLRPLGLITKSASQTVASTTMKAVGSIMHAVIKTAARVGFRILNTGLNAATGGTWMVARKLIPVLASVVIAAILYIPLALNGTSFLSVIGFRPKTILAPRLARLTVFTTTTDAQRAPAEGEVNQGIVVNGSCPIESPYLGSGSYNPENEAGHGGNLYWSGRTPCEWPIPILSMHEGCYGPDTEQVPGSEDNVCATQESTCSYYGYAQDVSSPAKAATQVSLPVLCDPDSSCDPLSWTVTWSNDYTSIDIGYSIIFSAEGNGHRWRLYFAHLNPSDIRIDSRPYEKSRKRYPSGTIVGSLYTFKSDGTSHLHIELNIDGVPQKPDFMCGG